MARNRNISITAAAPTRETTSVHGYMNSISMSNARKTIVTGYQRTWNREKACSAGGSPPVNGGTSRAARSTASSDDAP
jgi:hypothetical protein